MRFLALLAALTLSSASVAQEHEMPAGAGACSAASCCSADSEGACCCSRHGGDAHGEGMDHGAVHGVNGHAATHASGMHCAMHGANTHGAAETPAHEAVRATITGLFDAMRAGDGEALLGYFQDGATLTSVGTGRDGQLAARSEEITAFAEAVGTPHPEPYDERVGPIEVRVDGPLATAWMTYRFHVGERFSHCGVNAFQLADTGDGWKILAVTDTRRAECAEGE